MASNRCDSHGLFLRGIGTAAAALVVLAISGNAPAGEPKEQRRELLAGATVTSQAIQEAVRNALTKK